jgi:hypothetical protein
MWCGTFGKISLIKAFVPKVPQGASFSQLTAIPALVFSG